MPSLTRDEINRLSARERLTLIGDLWDSLSDADLPPPYEQLQELARRLASFEQDRAQAVSWNN
jgi:putative addiction module component (TIGR02574 family)